MEKVHVGHDGPKKNFAAFQQVLLCLDKHKKLLD